ncbi:hypothetical protein [Vibrio nigripulchritudo]|uniref:hypothetical protein n=1 Tax=Vibrio nigripulchritudo TaxID=28173 RepID=UPI0005FA24BF|nr:hypothetical protein [Vibrio nigripulchritudo]KJY73703.1 hypothetical protein TW74_20480 [Vibrio nigripulchritudo]
MNSLPSMQQPEGSLYCGAYCLVATLYAFNKLPFHSPLTLSRYNRVDKSFSNTSIKIEDSSNLTELAMDFYQVTGILEEGFNPEYIDEAGYNSLGAMLYILKECGLKTEVLFKDPDTHVQIQSAFPTEIELVNKLEVPISYLNSDSSTPDNGVLISVISYPNLHYVVNNSSGEWFDSDLEEPLFHWDQIERWDSSDNKRENASWLGISVRVTQ